MAPDHAKEAIVGPDPGRRPDGSVRKDDPFQPRADLLILHQPSASRFPSSEGPCDRGIPCPRAAWSADGLPGSHGPVKASVNEPWLTFGYPADRIHDEDDRSLSPRSSVDGRENALAAVASTIRQGAATGVPRSGGPCERGTPCPRAARSAGRFRGSHGPAKASAHEPSSTSGYRAGAGGARARDLRRATKRIEYEDDRAVRSKSSAGGQRGVLAGAALTSRQGSAASVLGFDGPCDPGTPSAPGAARRHGVPGSQGPPEASVKGPSLTIDYRPGASPGHDRARRRPCHDRPFHDRPCHDRPCHDRGDDHGGDDPPGHDRPDQRCWPRAGWPPRRCRSPAGTSGGQPWVKSGDRG